MIPVVVCADPAAIRTAARHLNDAGVRTFIAGTEPVFGRPLTRLAVGDRFGKPVPPADVFHLTERKVAYLECLADGIPYTQIAERFGNTVSGVKTMLSRLYKRLGANDRCHAVAIAFRAGILAIEDGAA